MKRGSLFGLAPLAVLLSSLLGCRLPGKPAAGSTPPRPDEVMSFDVLYRNNCQACHGANGRGGTAISLANPAYIAYAGLRHIHEITAYGIDGSLMPGFSSKAGGLLTDQQIQVLSNGIVSRWANPGTLLGAVPPAYESNAVGDEHAGADVYRTACLQCHAQGQSSILDPTYLALVSAGGLRTWIVAGQPGAGMPDWRGYADGPLTDQKVADLVAFLVSHRTAKSGQPSHHVTDVRKDLKSDNARQIQPGTVTSAGHANDSAFDGHSASVAGPTVS